MYGSGELLDDDDVTSYSASRERNKMVHRRKRKPFLILRYSRRLEEQDSTEETDDTLKGRGIPGRI